MGNALHRITAIYDNYICWSADFLAAYGGMRMFAQLFTGGQEYKDRPEHARFMEDIRAAAGDFTDTLITGDGRDELPAILRLALIDCHSRGDDWADWMLLAAEKHFLPCLELLSVQEAGELYEPYRRLRKKNMGLPPQDKILKTLRRKSRR